MKVPTQIVPNSIGSIYNNRNWYNTGTVSLQVLVSEQLGIVWGISAGTTNGFIAIVFTGITEEIVVGISVVEAITAGIFRVCIPHGFYLNSQAKRGLLGYFG